jgi:competence protein ComEA
VIVRIVVAGAILGLAAFALAHPPARPTIDTGASPNPMPSSRIVHAPVGESPIVYVAGAVRHPGLYRLRPGDRNARAVALAGGLTPAADAAAVNLAQRANDGDEIDVPVAGEAPHTRVHQRRAERRLVAPSPESVDVNRAEAAQLAAVPGIGRAVAQRIVEVRRLQGSFASLDELLDVAGMTQNRLERARPYLVPP